MKIVIYLLLTAIALLASYLCAQTIPGSTLGGSLNPVAVKTVTDTHQKAYFAALAARNAAQDRLNMATVAMAADCGEGFGPAPDPTDASNVICAEKPTPQPKPSGHGRGGK